MNNFLPGIAHEETSEIFKMTNGSKLINLPKDENIETTLLEFTSQKKQYFWQHVQDKLIVVLVRNVLSPDFLHQSPKFRTLMTPIQSLSPILAVYHRLDLLTPQYQAKLCLHLHYPATLETGSVFLTPYAFENPYEYMANNLTNKKITVSKNFIISQSNCIY